MRGRWARAALAVVALAIGTARPALAQQPAAWAHSRSDLTVDPKVRFGVLPNGMRYAILKNATPPGTVAIRMRMDVGSVHESDAQWGLAHFLEHMVLLRGTTHVPAGEQRNILERLGLQFGADTNASTSFLETIYRFDVPSADAAKIDTSLMLMREIASEALLPDEGFEAERPVVLSEERIRANVQQEASEASFRLALAGQRVASHMAIGTAESLKAAKPDQLRQFYRAYYRPERATLVIVGDLDPADVEAKIKARFADWRNPTPPPADPDYGAPQTRGPTARIFSRPDATPGLTVMWARPFDASLHDKARFRRSLVEGLAMNILSRRLYAQAASGTSPFASAGAGMSNTLRSAKITTLSASIKPDDWQRALTALIVSQRQISADAGVSRADLDVAISAARASLQTRAASEATRRSQQLANALVATIGNDDVFTPDSYDLALFEEFAPTFTPEEVSAAARAAFTGSGPLIFLSTTKEVPGGEAAVLAALAEAQKAPTSTVQTTVKAWPYTSFGTPGTAAKRSHIDDLDITQVRFANGVRLNVKSTKLVQDQIAISIRLGSGRMGLPKDRKSPDWGVPIWFGAGLKGLSLAEQQQIFAGKVHAEAATIGDDALLVSAQARPADFELELQLLTAYATVPAWRAESFERLRTVLSGALPQLGSSPTGVLNRDLARLIHSGDQRWGPPSFAEVQGASLESVRALVDPVLASGPMEITIVGDVTVDRAIEAVAATFGTLPPRPDPSRRRERIAFPRPTAEPVTLRHGGRPDQGLALAAWPLPDYYADPKLAVTMDVVAQAVTHRLFDQVRVAQGATYDTRAQAQSSTVFPGYGFFMAYAETPPDKVQSFYDTLERILAELRDKEITADELTRAVRPELEGLATAKKSNGYWIGRISGAQADPRQLDIIRNSERYLQSVTAADVRRAVQKYLEGRKAWRLRILPNEAAAAK